MYQAVFLCASLVLHCHLISHILWEIKWKPRIHACLRGLKGDTHMQVHYSKYVEPYVNKIPRGSTSTSTSRVIPPDATTDSASSAEVKKII